jgi:hypothetical protein
MFKNNFKGWTKHPKSQTHRRSRCCTRSCSHSLRLYRWVVCLPDNTGQHCAYIPSNLAAACWQTLHGYHALRALSTFTLYLTTLIFRLGAAIQSLRRADELTRVVFEFKSAIQMRHFYTASLTLTSGALCTQSMPFLIRTIIGIEANNLLDCTIVETVYDKIRNRN